MGEALIPLKRTTFTEKFKPWDFEEPAPGSNMGWTFGQLAAGENKTDPLKPKTWNLIRTLPYGEEFIGPFKFLDALASLVSMLESDWVMFLRYY